MVNAALAAFGHNGYKKASIADIAASAGVSKAMIFYWFGCKRNLYAYLVELCGNQLLAEVAGRLDKQETDFFDRLCAATEIKMAALRQHPAMLDFLKWMYNESDPEVADVTGGVRRMAKEFSGSFALDNIDMHKFKDSADPALTLRFILWASEGFIRDASATRADLDAYVGEFFRCMEMLKRNLYQEKYSSN